jgi:prevent-host-death family protein
MHVTATELKHRLGRYIDAAMREPVIVEKSGRNAVVMLSYEHYEQLEALEDAYWGARALAVLNDNSDNWISDGVAALEAIAKQKGV